MPQSLILGTTPRQGPFKRQRSEELPLTRTADSISTTQPVSEVQPKKSDDSARQIIVRIPSYLNKSKAKIAQAFQELEWKQRFRLQHGFQNPQTSPFRMDRSKTVFSRNRYGNVQPWDSSRVKLSTPIGGSDYVNASPISLNSRVKKVSTSTSTIGLSDSRYIATQGPKEGMFSHLWHMVMQETPGEIGVVIMLTQHFEGNKEKCAQYYPKDMSNPTMLLPVHEDDAAGGELESTDDGDPFLDFPTRSADADSVGTDSEASQQSSEVPEGARESRTQAHSEAQSDSVTLLSVHHDAKVGCEVRQLRLRIANETKTIHHYYFAGWPDFAKPEAEDRAALIELTRVTRSVAGDAPRVVHCSAGVGRTGTWIALDFLLHELEAGHLLESAPSSHPSTPPTTTGQSTNQNGTWGRSGPPKASTPDPRDDEDIIWETVNTLREQRMMMVMNELQYQFIYEVLKDAFIEKYTVKETGPVVIEVQEPSPKVARKKSPSVFGGLYAGTRPDGIAGLGDDGDVEGESEAETEVLGGDSNLEEENQKDLEKNTSTGNSTDQIELDPYAAVAPETIREGQKKNVQGEVRDHELR